MLYDNQSEPIVNKVASSGIVTLDLAMYVPNAEDIMKIDFKKYLFMEMILKEKEYRDKLKQEDFSIYKNKFVSVYCSVDAIIPKWAFMLLMTYIKPFTSNVCIGLHEENVNNLFIQNLLQNFNPQDYSQQRVVIKGCGDKTISDQGFLLITNMLMPFAKSIMYGEPCSTVPIFKNKN